MLSNCRIRCDTGHICIYEFSHPEFCQPSIAYWGKKRWLLGHAYCVNLWRGEQNHHYAPAKASAKWSQICVECAVPFCPFVCILNLLEESTLAHWPMNADAVRPPTVPREWIKSAPIIFGNFTRPTPKNYKNDRKQLSIAKNVVNTFKPQIPII